MTFEKTNEKHDNYFDEQQKEKILELKLPENTWIIFDGKDLISYDLDQTKAYQKFREHFEKKQQRPNKVWSIYIGHALSKEANGTMIQTSFSKI